jgi:hypothetical protein
MNTSYICLFCTSQLCAPLAYASPPPLLRPWPRFFGVLGYSTVQFGSTYKRFGRNNCLVTYDRRVACVITVISCFAASPAGTITQSHSSMWPVLSSPIAISLHIQMLLAAITHTKKQTMYSLARSVSLPSKNISPQFTALQYILGLKGANLCCL